MRFKYGPQLPGAGRTWAGHHHGSDTPTSPRAIYVLKSAKCNEIMPSVYVVGKSSKGWRHSCSVSMPDLQNSL